MQLAPEVIRLNDVAPRLAGGEATGLLAVPDSRVTQLAATGSLATTADLLRGRNAPTRDEFVHRLFGALSLEGVLYGLPWRWRGVALLLDSAAWQRAELELPPDHWRDDRWSLAAMETALARFQELAAADDPGPPPFRGGTRWSDWLPWLWLNGAALWQHGATATALTEPAAVTALQSYAEWRTTPRPAPGNAGAIVMVEPTWRTVGQALKAGQVAYPLPRGVWRTTLLRSEALLLTGAAAQPDAARRALVALATDAGQEIVAADGAGFPVWRATLAGRTLWEQWRETPRLVRALRTFIETGTYGAVPPYPSRWPEAERVLNRELGPALDGHARWLRWYSRRQRHWRRSWRHHAGRREGGGSPHPNPPPEQAPGEGTDGGDMVAAGGNRQWCRCGSRSSSIRPGRRWRWCWQRPAWYGSATS